MDRARKTRARRPRGKPRARGDGMLMARHPSARSGVTKRHSPGRADEGLFLRAPLVLGRLYKGGEQAWSGWRCGKVIAEGVPRCLMSVGRSSLGWLGVHGALLPI